MTDEASSNEWKMRATKAEARVAELEALSGDYVDRLLKNASADKVRLAEAERLLQRVYDYGTDDTYYRTVREQIYDFLEVEDTAKGER